MDMGSGFTNEKTVCDKLLDEHRDMVKLLMRVVDRIKIHQRLYNITDHQDLMLCCRDIEKWLDEHQ